MKHLKILKILNMFVFWPLGLFFLWRSCGWFACAGVFVMLLANNIQHYISGHVPIDSALNRLVAVLRVVGDNIRTED